MKITSIISIGREISIILDNGESAVFYPFGKTIYTSVSEKLSKTSLKEFKADILKTKWNVMELKKIWINK